MKREVDLRDRSYVPFALLFALFAGIFAARLYFGTGASGTLSGAASFSVEPSTAQPEVPQAATLENKVARIHSIVRPNTGGDHLGLEAFAAKNPHVFGARQDTDLESALAGVASFQELDSGELHGSATRTMPAPRTEPVLAASPFISQLTHNAARVELDGLEKSAVADEKIRHGRTLSAQIDMAAVRSVIEGRLHEARGCYERAAELDPGLFGVLRVEMTIDAAGAVVGLQIGESTIEDDELARCLSARIKSWTFPGSRATHATVIYPLVFNRS